jgi:hypothetical protein
MSSATDIQKQEFLDALAVTGVVAAALRATTASKNGERVQRNTVMRWRTDPEFEAAFQEALETATDELESEARRRAYEGVVRQKVIGSGENALLIEELQYSDPLLLALLKANRSDKFAERTKSEISGPGGTAIEMNDTSAAARIAAILDNAKARRDGTEPELDPYA